LTDVSGDHAVEASPGGAAVGTGDGHGDLVAGLMADGDGLLGQAADAAQVGPDVPAVGPHGCAVGAPGVEEGRAKCTDQLVAPVAEEPHRGAVGPQDPAVGADDEDGVGEGVE
jgi:hypothetical protein